MWQVSFLCFSYSIRQSAITDYATPFRFPLSFGNKKCLQGSGYLVNESYLVFITPKFSMWASGFGIICSGCFSWFEILEPLVTLHLVQTILSCCNIRKSSLTVFDNLKPNFIHKIFFVQLREGRKRHIYPLCVCSLNVAHLLNKMAWCIFFKFSLYKIFRYFFFGHTSYKIPSLF